MEYKTLYYDVTLISHRLPDDCLQIIAKYAYDKSRYLFLERIPKSTTHVLGLSRYETHVRLYVTNYKYYKLNYHDYASRYYIFLFDKSSCSLSSMIERYKLIENCWTQWF